MISAGSCLRCEGPMPIRIGLCSGCQSLVRGEARQLSEAIERGRTELAIDGARRALLLGAAVVTAIVSLGILAWFFGVGP